MGTASSSAPVNTSNTGQADDAEWRRRAERAEEQVAVLVASEAQLKRQVSRSFICGLFLGIIAGVALGVLLALWGGMKAPMEMRFPTTTQHDRPHAVAQATNGGGAAIVNAIVDLTWQMLSIGNVLHLAGSATLTGVYLFLLVLSWAGVSADDFDVNVLHASTSSAVVSLTYTLVLAFIGLRVFRHGDDGSRLVGGALQCGSAFAVLPTFAFGLEAAGLRWMASILALGQRHCASLADCSGTGAPLALLVTAAAGVVSSLLLHYISGFPLLAAPFFFSLYIAYLCTAMIAWGIMGLPRWNALLPEVLATLGFGLLTFVMANFMFSESPPEIYIGFIVTSMNCLLVSLPVTLLGCLELDQRQAGAEQPRSSLSVFRPLTLCKHSWNLIRQFRRTEKFAVAAGLYMVLWMFVMTKALRLHLWASRPFAVVSMALLAIAAPHDSHLWSLGFHIPLGLWLLGSVVYVEQHAAVGNGDPILQELLRWLGPQPAPFLAVIDSILQAMTSCSGLLCLSLGAACIDELRERSWIAVLSYWAASLLALALHSEAAGFFVGTSSAMWAIGLFLKGSHHIPKWAACVPRLSLLSAAARLAHIGHASHLVQFGSGFIICFIFVTLLFGERNTILRIRSKLLNSDALPAVAVSRTTAFMSCAGLVLYGAISGEALLITLGCFCGYATVATSMAGDDPVSIALVVAGCGVATMLLGEIVHTLLGPVQSALSPVLGNGQPLDLFASRALLRELAHLFVKTDASAELS